jgi:hypothetical protein
MKRELQRNLEDAMRKAIDRREWAGRPFTLRDVINDLVTDLAVMTPEVKEAIANDRLTEMIEDERIRTGVMPSTDRMKQLLECEVERLKCNRAELEKELNEVLTTELDDHEIN